MTVTDDEVAAAIGTLMRAAVERGLAIGNWRVALPLLAGTSLPARVVVAVGLAATDALGAVVDDATRAGRLPAVTTEEGRRVQ